MTILIAITGGSGSGKSTLAEALVAALPQGVAVLMREDSIIATLPACRALTPPPTTSMTWPRETMIC